MRRMWERLRRGVLCPQGRQMSDYASGWRNGYAAAHKERDRAEERVIDAQVAQGLRECEEDARKALESFRSRRSTPVSLTAWVWPRVRQDRGRLLPGVRR